MRPPDCHVCHATLADKPDDWDPEIDGFVTISFADAWSIPNVPGSGGGTYWFCNRHAFLGEARKDKNSSEALAEIAALLGREPDVPEGWGWFSGTAEQTRPG